VRRRSPPPPQPHLGHAAGGAGSRGTLVARNGPTTAPFADECQSFLDNVIAGFGQNGAWNDPPRPLAGFHRGRHSCGMRLSRAQDPTADLFWPAGAQEPCRMSAQQTSEQPSAAVVSNPEISSPRYVLPADLYIALQQLGNLELDRLLAATQHELQRRRWSSLRRTVPAVRLGAQGSAGRPLRAAARTARRRRALDETSGHAGLAGVPPRYCRPRFAGSPPLLDGGTGAPWDEVGCVGGAT